MKNREKLSVRETFVRAIESRILSGELRPGDRLPTSRELCAQMGVSLTIVNAGVAELQNKGFVEVKPRHGVYVTDYRENGNLAMLLSILRFNGGRLNAEDIRSFCETRLALDPLIAELAIRRCTQEDLWEWEQILERLRAETELEPFCVLITDFFNKLYHMSGNSILAMLYHSTMVPQQRMYQLFIEKNGIGPVMRNAEEIFRTVKAGDTEAAVRCMQETMRLPLEGETAII